MISRAPRDGDQSRPVGLPDCCRRVGAQLATARELRQISVEAIASRLLLSKGQIVGLELADPSPFYNTDFFLKGLRKYMASMGVPLDLLDERSDWDEEDDLRLTLAEPIQPRRSYQIDARSWLPAVTATMVLLVAGAGFYALTGWRMGAVSDLVALRSNALLPSAPFDAAAEVVPPVYARPAAAVVSRGDPDATVRVSVGKATWIFIRYPDNRVVERRLSAGEALEVGPLPVYLAVGTADSVELHVENRPVSIAPYIHDGQVRLTRPELARLVP